MCNFDRVAGLMIGARVAYLVMIGFLIAAAVASGGVFSAGGAVGLMIGAIASLAIATGLFIAALADIENCQGPCNNTLDEVRANLRATIAIFAIILIMLIALAIVAPVPVAGAVAVSAAVFWLTGIAGVLITIEAMVSVKLAFAFGAFNDCQVRNSNPSNTTLVTLFGIFTGISFVGGLVVGINAGSVVAVIIGAIAAAALGFSVSLGDDKNNP